MTKFRGRTHIKMDEKGRISLPAQFREVFKSSKKLIVTNNIHLGKNFLDFYTVSAWQKLEQKIAQLPSLKSEVQSFQRFYISSSEECVIDAHGRVLIPSHLREYGELHEEVVLVGVGDKIEVWSKESWQYLFGQLQKDFERVMNELATMEVAPKTKTEKK